MLPARPLSTELPRTGDAPGWFHHGAKILELLEMHKPKVCVELGTFLGASAIPVARSVKRWGGTLTCVDTWQGDHGAASTAPWLLVACVRNLIEAGLGPHIRLIPARSFDAALAWQGPIDYLYIDADHTYEGCAADLWSWFPYVRKGGLIVGDDYDAPLFPGVRRAWDEMETLGGLPLTRYQSTPPHPDGLQLVYGIKEY